MTIRNILLTILLILTVVLVGSYFYRTQQSKTFRRKDNLREIKFDDSVEILSLAFSPDSKMLITGNQIGMIRAWNVETSEGIQCIPAHRSGVTGLVFDDANRCISSGGDGDIKCWDLISGKQIFKLTTKNMITAMARNPTGRIIAVGSVGRIDFWDVSKGKLIEIIEEQKERPCALAYSPDGKLIATGGNYGSIAVFDISTKRMIFRIPGSTLEQIQGLAYSGDGKYLVAANNNGKIKIHSADTGKFISNLDDVNGGNSFVCFCKEANQMATGCEFGKVALWRSPDISAHTTSMISFPNGKFSTALVSPNGKYLAAGFAFNETRIWEIATGKMLAKHIGPERTYNWPAETAIPPSQ